MTIAPVFDFVVPDERVATSPPEARGLGRDQVRLMVARPAKVTHTRFRALGEHLRPGDVLVVNTSATRAAALAGTWRGRPILVHLSTELSDGRWLFELRTTFRRPLLGASSGDRIRLIGGGRLLIDGPGIGGDQGRLWRGTLVAPQAIHAYLENHGRPITYDYLGESWPLESYQTVFARFNDPTGASAEMPSAARPFTARLVADMISSGIAIVPVTLHAGVSSLERHEPPHAERYSVPAATAALVNLASERDQRVIAVGTTATRAIETVTDPGGIAHPGGGWTDLVLGPNRPARLVNGLVTGWHPPDASHLLLLESVAGSDLVQTAYRAALRSDYLWHEFGDSALFLP